MIKTRPTLDDMIFGEGDYLLALDLQELKLIAAILSMINLGNGGYGDVAYNLVTTLEAATDNPEFCLDAIDELSPKINIHDQETFDVANIYDHEDVSISL